MSTPIKEVSVEELGHKSTFVPPQNGTKALVKSASSGGFAGLIKTLPDAIQMASTIAKSGLVPQCYRTPDAAFAGLEMAKELGIAPMVFFHNSFFMPETGRIGIQGSVLLEMVYRSGVVDVEFAITENVNLEKGEGAAECTMRRLDRQNAKPFTFRFTIEQARRAGLLSKNNWKTSPEDMLLWRSISKCARMVCADIIHGVPTVEELIEVAETEDVDFSGLSTLGRTFKATMKLDDLKDIVNKEIPDAKVYAVAYNILWYISEGDAERSKQLYHNVCGTKDGEGNITSPVANMKTASLQVQKHYLGKLVAAFKSWLAATKPEGEPAVEVVEADIVSGNGGGKSSQKPKQDAAHDAEFEKRTNLEEFVKQITERGLGEKFMAELERVTKLKNFKQIPANHLDAMLAFCKKLLEGE